MSAGELWWYGKLLILRKKKGDGHNRIYEQNLYLIKKNEYFGIHEFFTDLERRESVYTKEFTTMFQINRAEILEIIKSNSQEYVLKKNNKKQKHFTIYQKK